jgi:hypothetical protein
MLWDPLTPLWIGSVTELQVQQRMLFSYLVSRSDSPSVLNTLYDDSAATLWVEHRQHADNRQSLLLIRPR